MMNKRSNRLVAWLLTLVMIFNIAPTTVFAEVGSGNYTGPSFAVVETLSDASVPNKSVSDGYTIKYIIKKEYTYTGENLVIREETRTEGNPSQEEPVTITGCSNADKNNATWDEDNRVLYFYPVPNTATVELRYMLIFTKANGELDIRTFQQIGNGEAGLGSRNGEFETVEFKHFNGDTDNIVIDTYQGVTIKQIFPFNIPVSYTQRDTVEKTSFGRDYSIEYYGHNAGIANWRNTTIGDIVRSDIIPWSYGQDQISLYFLVKAADDTSIFHNVKFVNYNDELLYETR